MAQPSDGDSPAALDQRLVRALDHPVRVGLLTLLAEQHSLSANEALPLLGRSELSLANVAYHLRVSSFFGLVEPVGESRSNGSPAFQLTSRGEAAVAALGLNHRGDDGEQA